MFLVVLFLDYFLITGLWGLTFSFWFSDFFLFGLFWVFVPFLGGFAWLAYCQIKVWVGFYMAKSLSFGLARCSLVFDWFESRALLICKLALLDNMTSTNSQMITFGTSNMWTESGWNMSWNQIISSTKISLCFSHFLSICLSLSLAHSLNLMFSLSPLHTYSLSLLTFMTISSLATSYRKFLNRPTQNQIFSNP